VNSQITLEIIVAFSVMTLLMIPLQQQIQQNAFAQDDESETDTEQRLRQKNLGSGESTNFNCDENLIDSSVSVICLAEPSPPPPPETTTLSVCKELRQFGSQFSPAQFGFVVIGNSPSPAQFPGDNNDGCVDVTIGPGEFIAREFPPDLGGNTLTVSIEGDCMQVFPQIRASGVIQAGETLECTFINTIGD
jgi:hypothetical protein